MFDERELRVLPVDQPAAVPSPRPLQDDPQEGLGRLRVALAGLPGPGLAVAALEAVDPVTLAGLGESGMLELVRAGQVIASWGEWLRLRGLEALYQSRRALGSGDLEGLASIADVAALVEAARRLQADSDDLAGRSVVAEAAAVCGLSEHALRRRLDTALELNRLPDTEEALRAGALDWPKTQSITDATRPLSDAHAAVVEARCLPGALRRNTRAVQASLAAAVMEIDPDGTARRHHAAKADRGVSFRFGRDVTASPDGLPDGTGEMTCRMGAVELFDLRRNLDVLAEAAKTDNDRRTLNQRRIDTITDLLAGAVTRCTPDPDTTRNDHPDSGPLADPPDSETASGSMYRINPATLPAPTTTGTTTTGTTTTGTTTTGTTTTAPEPHIVVTVGLDTLLGDNQAPGHLAGYGPIPAPIARDLATRGTWRCAATDDHGTILGLGRATFTPAYRPPAATARLIRHRDITCTFPGCRRQARHCDLDHRTPHRLGGATCECNLQALCGNHHRLKHEAGFRVRISEDPDAPPGTLTWTTPTGHKIRRYPVPAGRPRLPDKPPF